MRVIEKRQTVSELKDDAELFSNEESQDGELDLAGPYCICRGPDDGSPMICCDGCNEWYHTRCIKMSTRMAEILGEYYCRKCRPPANSNDGLEKDDGEYTFAPTDEEEYLARRKESQKKRRSNITEVESKRIKHDEDDTRKKVREALSSALGPQHLELSQRIEQELFDLFQSAGREYKMKFRSLHFNLKDEKNPQLRSNVLNGKISPKALCRMDVKDLANRELAEYRRARDEKYLDNVVITDDPLMMIKNGQKGELIDSRQPEISQEIRIPSISSLTNSNSSSSSHSSNNNSSTYLRSSNSNSYLTDSSALPLESADFMESFGDNSLSSEVLELANSSSYIPDFDLLDSNLPEEEEEPIVVPSFSDFQRSKKRRNFRKESTEESNDKVDTKDNDSNSATLDEVYDEGSNDAKESIKKVKSESTLKKPKGESFWSGMIKSNTNKFKAKAFHFKGRKVRGGLDENIVQVGRMPLDTCINYLTQITRSTSRQLTIIALEPDSSENEEDYTSTLNSLVESNRSMVIKPSGDCKEAFILPIKSEAEVPSWAEGYRTRENGALMGIFILSTAQEGDKKEKRSKDAKKEKHRKSNDINTNNSNPNHFSNNTHVMQQQHHSPPPLTASTPNNPLFVNYPSLVNNGLNSLPLLNLSQAGLVNPFLNSVNPPAMYPPFPVVGTPYQQQHQLPQHQQPVPPVFGHQGELSFVSRSNPIPSFPQTAPLNPMFQGSAANMDPQSLLAQLQQLSQVLTGGETNQSSQDPRISMYHQQETGKPYSTNQ